MFRDGYCHHPEVSIILGSADQAGMSFASSFSQSRLQDDITTPLSPTSVSTYLQLWLICVPGPPPHHELPQGQGVSLLPVPAGMPGICPQLRQC